MKIPKYRLKPKPSRGRQLKRPQIDKTYRASVDRETIQATERRSRSTRSNKRDTSPSAENLNALD